VEPIVVDALEPRRPALRQRIQPPVNRYDHEHLALGKRPRVLPALRIQANFAPDRAADDRIAELEAAVRLFREKAERAEGWLSRISTEIEDRLFSEPEQKQRLH
jgi:hypothetical protein